jgi:hypothetical protein
MDVFFASDGFIVQSAILQHHPNNMAVCVSALAPASTPVLCKAFLSRTKTLVYVTTFASHVTFGGVSFQFHDSPFVVALQ